MFSYSRREPKPVMSIHGVFMKHLHPAAHPTTLIKNQSSLRAIAHRADLPTRLAPLQIANRKRRPARQTREPPAKIRNPLSAERSPSGPPPLRQQTLLYSRQSERAVLTLCSTSLRPIVCWASIN